MYSIRWWIFPSIAILLFFAWTFSTFEAYGCDALLGTYSGNENGEPTARIEKQAKDYVVRILQNEGSSWTSATTEKLYTIPQHKLAGMVGIQIDKDACGLAGQGRVFLKLTKGAQYSVSSPTGKGFVNKESETGYLIWAASGFATGAIELHRVDPIDPTAAPLHILSGHTATVHSVHIFGKRVVSAAFDDTIRVWDIGSGALLKTWKGVKAIEFLTTSDGKNIALISEDHTIRLLDIDSGIYVATLHGGFVAINGKLIALMLKDNTIGIWDIESGALLHTLQAVSNEPSAIAISGKRFVSSERSDNSILIRDINNGILLRTLRGHTDNIHILSIVGSRIVSVDYDNTIRVWDIDSGALLHTLKGHTEGIESVSIMGNRIVSGSLDRTVRMWDITNGALLKTLRGHTAEIRAVSFAGNHIVSGGEDKAIRIWGVSSE